MIELRKIYQSFQYMYVNRYDSPIKQTFNLTHKARYNYMLYTYLKQTNLERLE